MASISLEGVWRWIEARGDGLVTNGETQPRANITTKATAVLIVGIIVAAAGITLVLPYWAAPPGKPASSSSTIEDGLIITPNASAFFPDGYYSHEVNISQTSSGDVVALGNVSFLYVTPTNIETRTMTNVVAGSSTTTVVKVTADYQCGTSLGQRRFFFPQFSNDSTTVRLDYCAVLNAALSLRYPRGSPNAWALGQVSIDTSPVVALYMVGQWDSVNYVALWVGR